MKRFLTFILSLLLVLCAVGFPSVVLADSPSQIPVISFEQKTMKVYGGASASAVVCSDIPAAADLAVSVLFDGESFTGTIPAGETKAAVELPTKAVETTAKLTCTLQPSSAYTVGAQNELAVSVTKMPSFVVDEKLVTAKPGGSCRILVDLKTPNLIYSDIPLSVRTEDGAVLYSFKYSKQKKAYIYVTFTAPESYDPEGDIYLYNDLNNEKCDSVGLALIRDDRHMISTVDNADSIAISFDCAYGETHTRFILDTLDEYGAKATFFMTSDWAHSHNVMAKEIVARGHEIGNHTIDHKNLNNISVDEVVRQISRANDIIEEASGVRPTVMRPPYGACNSRSYAIARHCGVNVIRWSDEAKDYEVNYDIQTSIDAATKKANAGDIVLFHNAATHVEETLGVCLQDYLDKGLKIVSVSELLLDEPYIVNDKGRQMVDPAYRYALPSELLGGFTPQVTVENAAPDDEAGGVLLLDMTLPETKLLMKVSDVEAIAAAGGLDCAYSFDAVIAPVAAGAPVGQAVFSYDGKELFTCELTASRDVFEAAPPAPPVQTDRTAQEEEPGSESPTALYVIGLLPLVVAAVLIYVFRERLLSVFRPR